MILLFLSHIQPLYAEFTLKDYSDDESLAEYLLMYIDNDGQKSLEEIRNLPDSMYSRINKNSVNIGYSDAVFWFKLNIKNNYPDEKYWIFESQYPLLDYISIFTPADSGYNEIHSGDRLTFSTMPGGYFNFITKIKSEPGTSSIYIRIKSEGAIIAKFRAWDEKSFTENLLKTASILWLFYGLLLALFLYSLFIFLSTRDRVYLALTTLILSCLFLTFIHNGMARKYLWPESIWWSNHSHPFFILLCIISMLWFTSLYFNTGINLRKSHFFLRLFIIISFPLSLSILLLPYSTATKISVCLTGIVTLFVILFIMIPMFTINRRLAFYYLCSWFLFSLGDFLLALRSYGIINESFLAAWSFQFSLTFAVIFLSIGVADKINSLRKDNEYVLKTLRESEERYRLFFETAHDAIVFYINSTPVYANKNMIKMSGYSETDFYNSEIFHFFPEQESSELKKIINELSTGIRSNARLEHFFLNKNNETLSVLLSLSSVSAGEHTGILMIISDISFTRKASLKIQEQYSEIQSQLNQLEVLNSKLILAQDNLVATNSELEKEKEFLSATLTSIGDGVISYDTSGKVFLINSVAEELTGISAADAIGRNIREILKLSDEISGELLFETLGTIIDKYNFSNIGVPFKLHDLSGNERIVELNSSVIKINNSPIGIVLALRDITIKTRIDNELIKMSKLESIGLLAGGIAHDFNNLLTGISANVSLLNRSDELPASVTDSLCEIGKAVDRASALTRQLLTFARGGNPLIKSHHIEEILKESLKFIIKNNSIKTVLTIDENLPPALIDPDQINQAINNLLINAAQAMPDGGTLLIELDTAPVLPPEIPLKPGKFIKLKITDTGCGIPKKNLNKIFDPFFTTKINGTGFGLTSTYSIIKKHRGYIRVESAENEGTSFEIYLRASDDKPEAPSNIISGNTKSVKGSILVMDDEEYILEVLVKMLKYHGFTVSTATTGEEAIAKYRKKLEAEEPFDYVILDLTVFNGMGGKETIKILRDIDPSVKAIVSSGYSENPVLANYREYGFSGILSKPYVIEDVIKSINSA